MRSFDSQYQAHFNSDSVRHHVQHAHVMRAEMAAELLSALAGVVRRWARSLFSVRLSNAEV